jgi:hypothetical protein
VVFPANPRGTRAQAAEEQQGSGNSSTFSSAVGSNISTDFRLLLFSFFFFCFTRVLHTRLLLLPLLLQNLLAAAREVDTQQKQQRRIHNPNQDFFLKMLRRR